MMPVSSSASAGRPPLADDPAFALNTAMMGDGAVIRVADGAAIARPIHLVFVTTPAAPVSVFTRSVLSVGKGAAATVIESHESADDVDHQVNHALDVSIGDEGRLDHVKIAREGNRALHIATLVTEIGAKAHLNDFTFTAGGAVTRNQIAMRLNGSNIHAGIRGATLLKDRQHTDNTLVVDHAVGHCESRELFKAVLDDESRSVFQGKIIVQPHAQKTDAKMSTHALLLVGRCRGRRQAGTGNLRRRRGLRPWRDRRCARRRSAVLSEGARHSAEGSRGADGRGLYRRGGRGDRKRGRARGADGYRTRLAEARA